MAIILAIILTSLLIFGANVVGAMIAETRRTDPPLTVAAIQARLAAESPRVYVPISRGW
ncbi:hypothetical protein [Nocardia tengchongensis]|uniref:hypothetical protein n=1 Tax=Nocardia tengchongensis TaxID=2055889 RepID=UPI0036C4E72D